MGNYTKEMFFAIMFGLSIHAISYSQAEKSIAFEHSKNESFLPAFIPHELKYGGQIREKSYNHQFYIAYYLIGTIVGATDGTRKHFSLGSSYTRFFGQNHVSIFPYYGSASWYGAHSGLKLEPLFNLSDLTIDYLNFEYTLGWFLSLSIDVGIPLDHANKPIYFGFKVGYALPYPIITWKRKKKKEIQQPESEHPSE